MNCINDCRPILNIPYSWHTDTLKPCVVSGATIGEFILTFDIDITGADFTLVIKNGARTILNLSTTDGGLTVTGANTLRIDQIDYQNNNLPVGVFKGDLDMILGGIKNSLALITIDVKKDFE